MRARLILVIHHGGEVVCAGVQEAGRPDPASIGHGADHRERTTQRSGRCDMAAGSRPGHGLRRAKRGVLHTKRPKQPLGEQIGVPAARRFLRGKPGHRVVQIGVRERSPRLQHAHAVTQRARGQEQHVLVVRPVVTAHV